MIIDKNNLQKMKCIPKLIKIKYAKACQYKKDDKQGYVHPFTIFPLTQ